MDVSLCSAKDKLERLKQVCIMPLEDGEDCL